MARNRYASYKPSGIEWLSEVPRDWEIKRLKYFASANDDVIGEDTPPDWQLNYVDIGNVDLVEGITAKEPMIFEDAPSRARRRVADGDTIVSTVRTYLKAISPVRKPEANLVVSTGFAVIRPRKIDAQYLSYWLRAEYFVQAVVSRSTGVSYPGINTSELVTIPALFPSWSEQQAIAAFLDRAVGKIDALVAKKFVILARLKEKRVALISRAVTRGISDNPSLKSSEVLWVGKIPNQWVIRKFSREVSIAEGQVDPEVEPFLSMTLIGPEHMESATGRLLARVTAAAQAAESGKYLCRKGDVVYSKIRPGLRKVVIAPEDCLCSADVYPMRSRGRLTNEFLYWFLLSDQYSAWSVLESDRVAMPKINRDTLNELRLPVPPRAEQIAIAKYLGFETAKLDALIAKVAGAIERLQEYRTALITAAVTGTIDVTKD
jgi:type I restriction enzyme, S subunit